MSEGDGPGHRVFVYGTFIPGDVRWPLIADDVEVARRAKVRGTLYDTGRGYPAACFGGDRVIEGWVYELRSRGEALDAALADLDEIEAVVEGMYRRVVVTTTDGDECWSYELGEDPTGMVGLDGVWPGAGLRPG